MLAIALREYFLTFYSPSLFTDICHLRGCGGGGMEPNLLYFVNLQQRVPVPYTVPQERKIQLSILNDQCVIRQGVLCGRIIYKSSFTLDRWYGKEYSVYRTGGGGFFVDFPVFISLRLVTFRSYLIFKILYLKILIYREKKEAFRSCVI